jgi:epoxyqueuosine reductase
VILLKALKPPKSRKNFSLILMDGPKNQVSSMIKSEALRLGFDACGISHVENLDENIAHLKEWLLRGYHGNMKFMENHVEKRINPEKIVEGARSVISVLLNYYTTRHQADADAPVLSKYAYGEDYHKVIRKKLKGLLRYINESIMPAKGRIFIDSAPLFEKAWAAKAGLGWTGKNSLLISPKAGSFFFIGTLVVDVPLETDKPVRDYCGSCAKCMEACPTNAIVAPHVLDARKCIAYHTIESKEKPGLEFMGKFSNRMFGCDICQDVCPWNTKAYANKVKEFEPLPELLQMTRNDWFAMTEQLFDKLFAKSPVKRAGFERLKKNLEFIS